MPGGSGVAEGTGAQSCALSPSGQADYFLKMLPSAWSLGEKGRPQVTPEPPCRVAPGAAHGVLLFCWLLNSQLVFHFTDKSSVAGSEEAEPQVPPIKPIKPVTRHKPPPEPPVKKGRRSRRCGQCPGCQVPEDCGVCTNCLDKPKFGGRNIKKQCCK